MKKEFFIKNEQTAEPFQAADGATIFVLLDPQNSGIRNMSIVSGLLEHGKTARMHYHLASEEIYYVLAGKGKVRIGERTFDVSAGDAIHIPVNTVHGLINMQKDQPLKMLAVLSPPHDDADIFFED